MKSRSLEYYYWYKSAGICVKCKQENAEKGIFCLKCRMDERQRKKKKYPEKMKTYMRELKAKRKAEHICVKCGRPLPSWDKRVSCGICRAKENAHKREVSQKQGRIPLYFRGDGEHCAICFKPVETKGKKLCNRCYNNCIANLAKTSPEAWKRSKKTFQEYNTIFWNEGKRIACERQALFAGNAKSEEHK